jgi:OHCU decarboxylase
VTRNRPDMQATPPRPSRMGRAEFVQHFGGIYEHSPWIAEQAFDAGIGLGQDSAPGLHSALAHVFRSADDTARLGVLTAHPDLAGKLAAARRLTPESTAEQAGAGLDALTDAERARFSDLNARYVARFGFPFILAVRDHDKAAILETFERRLTQDRDSEFAEACHQVERIAHHRLTDVLMP